jgi:hypothetical protein
MACYRWGNKLTTILLHINTAFGGDTDAQRRKLHPPIKQRLTVRADAGYWHGSKAKAAATQAG